MKGYYLYLKDMKSFGTRYLNQRGRRYRTMKMNFRITSKITPPIRRSQRSCLGCDISGLSYTRQIGVVFFQLSSVLNPHALLKQNLAGDRHDRSLERFVAKR